MADAQPKRMRAIDLFCGAGGSSWGASQAGVEIVAAFDAWELAGLNHHANFPGAKFFPGRLEDVDLSKVARDIGDIDLILASPECTNHSPARGKRPKNEESKNTAFQVVRFAKKFEPKWIVIENVVSMRNWSRYDEFKEGLTDAGYQHSEHVLNSSDFGVPQSRRRLFLVCSRDGDPPPVKKRRGRKKHVKSILNLNGKYKWTPLNTDGRAQATLDRAARGIDEVGKNTPFLIVYYGTDHAGGWQPLARPLRTITTLDRFALVKPTAKGHVMRMLQVPELQSAMGMSSMVFNHGSRREKIKMIGNAVCPPVMQAVIEQLSA